MPIKKSSKPPRETFDDDSVRDIGLTFEWRARDEDFHPMTAHFPNYNRDLMCFNRILAAALLASHEGRWVSFSRRKEFYTGKTFYFGYDYTYTNVTRAIDNLVASGLLEEDRSLPGQRGRQSRFRATGNLMALWAEADILHDPGEAIRLKDEEGKLIPYDRAIALRMRQELRHINDVISMLDLEFPESPGIIRTRRHVIVDGVYSMIAPPSLYRVFNRGSFRMGGRAYGFWQQLPKDIRALLRMNGEPVEEPDFTHMHPSLLYAERGLVLRHDPYDTGTFSRDDGKLACLIALNARSLEAALSSLHNRTRDRLSRKNCGELIDALKQLNPAIADDFHADRGVTLMRRDSEIILGAVKHCLDAGIPVLPVHDSMLAPQRHASRVAEIMEESAAHVLKLPNSCKVKGFSPSVPQMPPLLPSSLLPPLPQLVQLSLFGVPAPESFSARMKQIRQRLGLSQRELGEHIGCRQPHIANVERGHSQLGGWPQQRLRELMKKAA